MNDHFSTSWPTFACTLIVLCMIATAGCGPTRDGSDYPTDPRAVEAVRHGWSALEEGNYLRALQLAEGASRVDPESPAVMSLQGTTYQRLERYEEARFVLEKLVAQFPHFPEGYLKLGNIHLRQSRFRDAVEAYERQLKLEASAAAWYNLGLAHTQLNDPASARKAFQNALEEDAGYAQAYASLADLAEKEGAFDEAVLYAQEAVQRRPGDRPLRAKLGFTMLRAGQSEEAVAVLENLLEEAPWDYQARYHLGQALQRLGRNEEAESQLERAESDRERQASMRRLERSVRLDPTNGQLHFALGIEYQKWGRLEDARASYQLARQIDPDNSRIEMNLATVHLHQGDLEGARTKLREVIARDSTIAAAWLNLGFVEARLLNEAEAQRAWQRAISLDRQYAPAISAFRAQHAVAE